jgi:hypothetical protein
MNEPRTSVVILAALGAVVLGGPGVVAAEPAADARAGPAILLELLGRAPESRGTAYDESLKTSGPRARGPAGVPQPDGSLRYGNVSVYVKEMCPEGVTLDVPPLPGRRRPAAH